MGAPACSAVCTPTGHGSVPGDGDLSILLIEGAAYQDVYLSCSATLGRLPLLLGHAEQQLRLRRAGP